MKSSLAQKEILSPNFSPRTKAVKKFTIHHAAVVAPAENVAKNFQNAAREASSNYVIGSDGTIILSVPEENRAWTSGNADNDQEAITVEVCNSIGSPEWRVSDAAMEAVINLGVDICKRYGLSGFTWTGDRYGTLTIHKMFQATNCPGPYLESKMSYIAEEITKRVNTQNEVDEMLYKVQVGAFSEKANAEKLLQELKAKGYNGFIVEVDDGKTAPTPVPTPTPTIGVGSRVKIKSGAKSFEGVGMANFVYNKVYTVDALNGTRAVLDKNGLCTAFHIDNLILV